MVSIHWGVPHYCLTDFFFLLWFQPSILLIAFLSFYGQGGWGLSFGNLQRFRSSHSALSVIFNKKYNKKYVSSFYICWWGSYKENNYTVQSFIRPTLEYAAVVWNPHSKKKFEKVQRAATRRVPCQRDFNYEERLEKQQLPTLSERRERGDNHDVEMCWRNKDRYKWIHNT